MNLMQGWFGIQMSQSNRETWSWCTFVANSNRRTHFSTCTSRRNAAGEPIDSPTAYEEHDDG